MKAMIKWIILKLKKNLTDKLNNLNLEDDINGINEDDIYEEKETINEYDKLN